MSQSFQQNQQQYIRSSTFSLLKKCVGDPAFVVPLESVTVKESLFYADVPVEILDRQVRRLRNKEVTSVFQSFMHEFSLRIIFPQFVLAFLGYLHVLGTQFSQKLRSQCLEVGIAELSLYLSQFSLHLRTNVNVTPHSQKRSKISFSEKYALPTVASKERSLKHGPSCTTIDGIRNSQKISAQKKW